MSRREEVDHLLSDNSAESGVLLRDSRKLCRTLADEVDAKDAVVEKLLVMLEPGPIPYEYGEPTTNQYVIEKWRIMTDLHAAALEIVAATKGDG